MDHSVVEELETDPEIKLSETDIERKKQYENVLSPSQSSIQPSVGLKDVSQTKLPVSEPEVQAQTSFPEQDSSQVEQSLQVSPQSEKLSVYNFELGTTSTVVKRARGRPRKDIQRTSRHHGKVFPGRPRLKGKKFGPFFMSHASVPTYPQNRRSDNEGFDDCQSDVTSNCSPTKMHISALTPDNELKIEKFCVFCNLSESSLLGQGKFKFFKPTPGFEPEESFKKLLASKERDDIKPGGDLKILFKKNKHFKADSEHSKYQKARLQGFSENTSIFKNPMDELEYTGFKVLPEFEAVFHQSGEISAHLKCAVWSIGVVKTIEKKLTNVDKAVIYGLSQKCHRCDRYGATVKCCEADCNKIFHYPCAVISGVLQNIYSSKMICSSHLEDLTSFGISCSLCNNSGDITQLLLCAVCSNYYHGPCLDPPINSTPEVRAAWQCFDCKVCQCCSRASDGSKMLVCTTCDKGYHNFCLKPAIVSVPKSGWKCPNCRLCGDCGARTPGNGPSSRWHLNYTVCDSCYQQRNKGIACPLCGKAYRQFSKRKEMKHCSVCQKYIHQECDKRIGLSSNFGYVCPICASSTEEKVPEITILSEYPPKDNFHTSSRDSFISGNEESISSVESEYLFNPGKFSKRRSSSAAFRHKKSQKPKFKSFPMPGFAYPTSSTDSKDYKQDDDPSEDNKMILASATDEYVLCQDLCVMCGSFGKGEEGRLIACAQCGQCYHSYCASIKVTAVVLKKGWRCLDCTVCEGCGQPHDESRLLLCDECDISFHIYCLDPPLQEVPQGNWKCKWCVLCIKCGSKSPGYKCNWQVNYTHCGPCASILICCWCQLRYEENDLIVQCSKCERWLHGLCDHISTEEDAEKCADCDYMCPHCRPADELPPHLLSPSRSSTPETEPVPEKHTSPTTKVKEQDPPAIKSKHQVQFYLDGVCLSESGIQYIKALMPEQPKKIPRPRKMKQSSLGASTISDPQKLGSGPQIEKLEDPVTSETGEIKFDIKNEETSVYDADEKNSSMDVSRELPIEANAEKKKRPRKLQKMGIGGFIVKPRGRSLSKDPMEADTSAEVLPSETPSLIVEGSDVVNLDKPKRKRKPKKKTALDERFPNYLRDAFFGKDLLTSCKKLSKNIEVYEHNTEVSTASKQTTTNECSKTQSTSEDSNLATTPDGKHLKITDNVFVQDVKGFISSGNILSSKQTNMSKLVTGKKSRSDIESLKEESVSAGLSSSLPQMDCKDVEDVFQGVLRDHRMSQSVQFRLKYNVESCPNIYSTDANGSPIIPKNAASYVLPQSSAQVASQPSHPEFLQHFQHQDSNHSWTDSECDQSQMQKNMLKWESDENLGLLSTISPVLYANINLPHLKIEFPNWSDRVKQIAKIWRSLPAEKRQPYLQRARENRTASRSQKCNADRDPERSIKDAKVPEVDAEKQWKQFQALRQMQLQNQQRILQEKRVQVAMKARIDKPENSPDFDLNKEIKLFQSKSLSDVPQLPISDSSHLSTFTSKDIRNKIYDKRWSTGTSPDLSSGNVVQVNKAKIQTPPPLQQSLVHERIPQSSLIQVSRVRTPVESPHQSIPDAPVPQVPASKPLDVYHKSTISSLTQHGSTRDVIPSRQAILANQIELSRVPSPMLQKETLYTPPSTPRPQSSESFFQIASGSPQSHLLSSMDSHSQPTPMSSKMVSTPPSVSRLQEIDASALAKLSPKISPSSPGLVSQISALSHEAIGRQSIAVSVGNASPNAQLPKQSIESSDFAMQSGLNFPSANLSKELSHYKSAYPAISKLSEREQLLVQTKSLEHRNLDQFLQGNRISMDDSSKVNPNLQLRDLLQNKKPDDPSLSLQNQDVSTVNDFKHEPSTEQIIPRIEPQSLKMDVAACNSPSSRLDNNLSNNSKSFSNEVVNSQPASSSIHISPSSSGVLHEKEKASDVTDVAKSSEDISPLNQPSAKDSLDSVGKRKTTAADLVKDLESQHEHDVITSGCNLDALTGDVGELELDDDELLGLGNDFNILEYADPELDKGMVGEGEKSNILDEHLDLDDKDEELEAEVIKEQDNPQEKDLIPNPPLSHEKKEPLSENQKSDNVDKPASQSDLQENFLNFKKDSFGDAYKQDADKCSVDELTCTIKEEPKSSFSSCNLSSEICSSDIDIKPEKNIEDVCSMQKKHHLAFSQETQSIAPQRTELHCSEQILPPPYRMVTALKQNINPQSPQHQPNPLSSQNKNLFPLHMNINVRHDLQLPQQGVMPLPVQTNRPLLLQEQPLILQDLVEEEKRAQRHQTQEGLISPDALLSDIDFERLKDDVFSGPPDDSIGGPGSLLGSHEPPLQVSGSHSVCVSSSSLPQGFGPPPYPLLWQGQDSKVSLPSRPLTIMQNLKTKTPVIGGLGSLPGSPIPQKAQTVAGNVPNRPFCQSLVSTPPSPPIETLDPEKLKLLNHEKYLLQQQALLSSQQKFFETDVIKLRKLKKALNAKQRQMRKNGSELSENDAIELNRVSQEQAVLQKQLDQVRKQTRQNSIAIQDYRLKQQKRQQQQQPPQQVPRSPLHTSVSSVQSSPQNSQSPLQFQSQTAPQSPMMPSSPVGQSPSVRIQHSHSPLLHHSPVSLPPSSVHQTSPHIHQQQQQLFSQQMSMHMQAAKPEAKGWGSAVKGTQVGGENLQISERFQKRELQDRSLSTSPFPFPSTAVQSPISESGKDPKKSSINEAALKRFPDETASPSSNAEAAEKQIIASCASGSEMTPVSEQKMETDPEKESVSPNILSQSLPSSVTNTLKFTLRQTGMPTVCLQTGDSNSVDGSSQITYNLSPAEITMKSEQKILHDPVESKVDIQEILSSSSDMGRTELGNVDVKLIKEEDLSNEIKIKSPHREMLDTNSSQSHKMTSDETKCKQEQIVSTNASLSDVKPDQVSTCKSQGTETKIFARNTSLSETDQNSKEGLLSQIIKQEIVEDTPVLPTNNSKVLTVIKTEFGSADAEHLKSSEQLKKDLVNDASSDEELENLRKATNEQEHEQNVLLKQLLQNCPSAETSRKADNLVELKKDDVKDLVPLEVPFELNESSSNKKSADSKTKKQTYLGHKILWASSSSFTLHRSSAVALRSKSFDLSDIRRAQLDKEPTPPPGDSKIKPIKRKRPKKKKLEDKMDSMPKKKCRRSSSKQEDGYENYVENLMTKLTNLPPLRILEPNIKPNFNAIPIFGTGDLNVTETQLRGCYGSATLPNENDIYSCLPYSREEPPSTSSLPPSSPPYRGFYNQEFPPLAKALERNEMSDVLRPYAESESRKIFRDAGSPDTIISSSSPETCLFEPLSKWPELVFVDHLNPASENKSYSPVIPLVYPIPIRIVPRCRSDSTLSLDLDDKDKENIPHPDDKSQLTLTKTKLTGIGGYSAPLKDSGNVAVTLTLSSAAAEDICGVLSALADLLKIPIPATYDIVERTATPPSQKLGLYRQSKNSSGVNIHTLLNGKPRFCRHCDIVVLSAGIRKKAVDLTCISREEQDEDEVIFCSTNCYMQFALTHQSSTMLVEKEAAAVVGHTGETNCPVEKPSTNLNTEDSLNLIKGSKDGLVAEEDSKSDIADLIKSEFSITEDKPVLGESTPIQELNSENSQTDSTLCVKNLEKLEMEKDVMETTCRKWISIKYKYWSPACDSGIKTKLKEETVEKPTRSFYHTIKPSQMPKDERRCTFCHVSGDGDTNGSARLLNVDVNKWVHLNCALWSAEVYETVNGALMNVETAYKRSMHLSCCHCHKQGASVRCFKTRCPNVYHFPCARKEQCSFYKDKTVLCPQHVSRGNYENKLDSVAVFRRVYVNRDEHKQVASMIQGDQYVMRIGSLIFLNIGQLLPTQIQAFHTSNCIYPVGYKIVRMYWSMKRLGRRSQYVCTISENSGKPEFSIQVKEVDQKEVLLKDKTAKGVWQKVVYPIEKMRRQAKTIKIFPDFIHGDDLFGLTEPAVLRIIESLPGVDTLSDYNFRYGRSPFLELPLAINPTGCARSEPKLRTHFKRPHTLHTSHCSRSSFHSAFSGFEVSSPYIKQFVHSKSSQYRKMKTEWRNNVYLARSRIQGLGLYAARDLEKHTMVIEYIGQLIRNEIAERNEAVYDAQNRGVYMFRLDENRVIDATLSGGLARYMNHSCHPNCVAEVVQIDRENRILIITNRRITRGEELSYDYKFEVEDDQHKIPCLCGAGNCRKWMN